RWLPSCLSSWHTPQQARTRRCSGGRWPWAPTSVETPRRLAQARMSSWSGSRSATAIRSGSGSSRDTAPSSRWYPSWSASRTSGCAISCLPELLRGLVSRRWSALRRDGDALLRKYEVAVRGTPQPGADFMTIQDDQLIYEYLGRVADAAQGRLAPLDRVQLVEDVRLRIETERQRGFPIPRIL